MTDEEAKEMFRAILKGYESLTIEARNEINGAMGFHLGEKIRRCLPEHGGKGQLELSERRKEIFRG